MKQTSSEPLVSLVVTPRPMRDESLSGYLVRLAEENGYHRPALILDLIKTSSGEPVTTVLDLVSDAGHLASLERLADLPSGSLDEHHWLPIESVSVAGKHYGVHGEPIALDALMVEHAQVCPRCLAESRYAKQEWDFTGVTICTVHAAALVDACHACGKRLSPSRPHLMCCGDCGMGVREADTEPASTDEVTVAQFLSAVAPYRLDVGTETILDGAHSLFALVHALSFSTEDVLSGRWRARQMRTSPVSARRLASQRVAKALEGSVINGVKLHGLLLEHVAHRLPYLPRTFCIEPLYHFLAQGSYLSVEARQVLSLGRLGRLRTPGSEVFANRPPSITTTDDAKKFLGCSDEVWSWLQRHHPLRTPQDGEGYDIDALLEARERCEAIVSFDVCDSLFRVPGLTQRLVKANVLRPTVGHQSIVDLNDVGRVLDVLRLHSEHSSTHEFQGGSLQFSRTQCVQSHASAAYAALIARAMRSDVSAFAWKAPFGFDDFWVSTADVASVEADVTLQVD